MYKNKIVFIFFLILAFLFLQGCQDNIILPDTVNQLQTPRLLYPPNDTTDVDIPMTFYWNGGRNINNYTLQVSDDSLFGNLVYNQNVRTTTIRDVTGLNNQTKYYWRVDAINGYGESHWSNIRNFTTGKFCNGISIVEYSGKIYKTVQIGEQCWLRENLDVGVMIDGGLNPTDNDTIEKYCYNNDILNCNIYGGLYQWNEAMQYATKEGSQGICPPGWHIPTYYEFQVCSTTVGGDGNALKAVEQALGPGAGTNTTRFSALLAGIKDYNFFYGMGVHTNLWSSTGSYEFRLVQNNFILIFQFSKSFGLSIRCIKN